LLPQTFPALDRFLQGGTLPHEILGTFGILPQILPVNGPFKLLLLSALGIDLKDTPEDS